jgi:hypothetical protein
MQPNIQQLLYSIEKKFQTTMIGALARFEDSFGYLWENDHKDRERFENTWEDTRNNILNNGNKQLRLALNEISDFFQSNRVKNKYHYKFYFNDKNNNREDDSYEN